MQRCTFILFICVSRETFQRVHSLLQINSEKTVIPILRNTVMSSQLDHKATVLEYKGETFAYLDTILDKEGSWVKNRNFFLWVPVY